MCTVQKPQKGLMRSCTAGRGPLLTWEELDLFRRDGYVVLRAAHSGIRREVAREKWDVWAERRTACSTQPRGGQTLLGIGGNGAPPWGGLVERRNFAPQQDSSGNFAPQQDSSGHHQVIRRGQP